MRKLMTTALAVCLSSVAFAQTQTCMQTAYGQPCGPTLTVSFQPIGEQHQLTMSVANAFPSSHGLWIWGALNLTFPIPGSPCFLYTDFVYGHPFVTDSSGRVEAQRAWPATVSGYLRLQAASIMVENNQLVIRATNGVLAECNTM